MIGCIPVFHGSKVDLHVVLADAVGNALRLTRFAFCTAMGSERFLYFVLPCFFLHQPADSPWLGGTRRLSALQPAGRFMVLGSARERMRL